MKPFKAAQPLAVWLLRIAVSGAIIVRQLPALWPMQLHSTEYYLNLLLVFSALMLLAGGVLSRIGLTIFGGGAICAVCCFHIIANFSSVLDPHLYVLFVWFAGGFYFIAYGNK